MAKTDLGTIHRDKQNTDELFREMLLVLRKRNNFTQHGHHIQVLQSLFSELSSAEKYVQADIEAGFHAAKKTLKQPTEVLSEAIKQNNNVAESAFALLQAMHVLYKDFMQKPVAEYLSQQEKNAILTSNAAFAVGVFLFAASIMVFVIPQLFLASLAVEIIVPITLGFLFLAVLSAGILSIGMDYLEKPFHGDTETLKIFVDADKKNRYVDFSVFRSKLESSDKDVHIPPAYSPRSSASGPFFPF